MPTPGMPIRRRSVRRSAPLLRGADAVVDRRASRAEACGAMLNEGPAFPSRAPITTSSGGHNSLRLRGEALGPLLFSWTSTLARTQRQSQSATARMRCRTPEVAGDPFAWTRARRRLHRIAGALVPRSDRLGLSRPVSVVHAGGAATPRTRSYVWTSKT